MAIRLGAIKEFKGWSQKTLAKKAGVSESQASRWLNRVHLIGQQQIDQLVRRGVPAEAFDLSKPWPSPVNEPLTGQGAAKGAVDVPEVQELAGEVGRGVAGIVFETILRAGTGVGKAVIGEVKGG